MNASSCGPRPGAKDTEADPAGRPVRRRARPLALSPEADAGRVELSIVVPLYNEADNVPALYERIKAAADALGRTYELILIDDGSTDGTGELIEELASGDDRVVAISFPRNFGQTAALSAGIEHARFDAVVTIDADLQNDPADIPRLLVELEKGRLALLFHLSERFDHILGRVRVGCPHGELGWDLRELGALAQGRTSRRRFGFRLLFLGGT